MYCNCIFYLYTTSYTELLQNPHLPTLQHPYSTSGDNQNHRHDSHSNKPLPILRRIHLLPDNLRQPSLEDIRHFIHAADNQGSFFVVVGADFMSPAVSLLVSSFFLFPSW